MIMFATVVEKSPQKFSSGPRGGVKVTSHIILFTTRCIPLVLNSPPDNTRDTHDTFCESTGSCLCFRTFFLKCDVKFGEIVNC